MRFAIRAIAVCALWTGAVAFLTAAVTALAQSGQTVRIAYIDPLSGPFANVGQNQLRAWQFVASQLSGVRSPGNPAGVRFEVTGFDNKGLPQDSLNALGAAIDQGFRYVTQGAGSGAGMAIADAVSKHNARHPGAEVIYLNYAAVDPAMTGDKCSYWHFRLVADTAMKMKALTLFLKDQPQVHAVYLINQNYSHGQQVVKYFTDGLQRLRPGIRIVGNDLHPLGQVKDFAPYAAKIRQSSADAIVTGNWGADLTLLVRALHDAGLKLPLYTYYAQATDTPTALAALTAQPERSVGQSMQVYTVAQGHSNPSGELGALQKAFKATYHQEFYTYQSYDGIRLLSAAMAQSQSTDPVRVAAALEGLSIPSYAGTILMRRSDHQLQQSLFIAQWQKIDQRYPYSLENTGYTFVPVRQFDPEEVSTPSTCGIQRPA